MRPAEHRAAARAKVQAPFPCAAQRPKYRRSREASTKQTAHQNLKTHFLALLAGLRPMNFFVTTAGPRVGHSAQLVILCPHCNKRKYKRTSASVWDALSAKIGLARQMIKIANELGVICVLILNTDGGWPARC